MHSYSIDDNIRGKMILVLFTISILLSTLLTAIFGDVLSYIITHLKNISWLTEFIYMCDKLGVTSNYIGVPFLYGLIYWIYDNYVWKLPIIIKIHKVPNLRGKWIGTLTSSYNDQTIKMEMEISQTWNKISLCSIFPDTQSKSESNMASIFINSNGVAKVGFGFVNHSRLATQQQYDGYNVLDLDDDKHIFGRYFNNRDNQNENMKGGNKGTFELVKSE